MDTEISLALSVSGSQARCCPGAGASLGLHTMSSQVTRQPDWRPELLGRETAEEGEAGRGRTVYLKGETLLLELCLGEVLQWIHLSSFKPEGSC